MEAEVGKTEAVIERYFPAFEASSMPESQCRPRIRSIGEGRTEPQCRCDDLRTSVVEIRAPLVTDDQVAIIKAKVRSEIEAWVTSS